MRKPAAAHIATRYFMPRLAVSCSNNTPHKVLHLSGKLLRSRETGKVRWGQIQLGGAMLRSWLYAWSWSVGWPAFVCKTTSKTSAGAHYILGPFGEDSDLRRWGLKPSARGGKNAKKRAVVAVARKLTVLLHRL